MSGSHLVHKLSSQGSEFRLQALLSVQGPVYQLLMVETVGTVGSGLVKFADMPTSVLSIGEGEAFVSTREERLYAGSVEITGHSIVCGIMEAQESVLFRSYMFSVVCNKENNRILGSLFVC